MFTLSASSLSFRAAPPSTAAPSSSRRVTATCARAGSKRGEDKMTDVDAMAPSRRGVASALAMGVLSFAASRAEPALAFGSGIPGYDINEKARSAIRDANNKELDEQKRIAREFREAKAREREAAAAAAASSAPATEAGEAQ